MKLSELIKEIEEVEGVPYDAWCKTKSGIEIMVTPKTGFMRFLRISYKEDDISIAIKNESIKDTICDARKKLVKLGFVDDLQDSPQELMKSAIDRIIKQRQEEGVTLLTKEFKADQKEEAKKHDAVNHPSHYTQGEVECIDALESATINKRGIEAVCTANIIKYLWRYESKNGIEDVKKAQWYLQKLIKELEKQQKE